MSAPELERGREQFRRREWDEAYRSMSAADRAAPLGVDDLESYALAAYLSGREAEYVGALERAYHAHLDADERCRAASCAFWIGFRLAQRRESGRATGWLGRARRLLDGEDSCVDGYLLLPVAGDQLESGEIAAAFASAGLAADIGERFRDRDLVACARHLQGHAHLAQERVAEGLAILDEVMVSVTAGELSPLVTGLLYCSVIDGCQRVYALGRACEWTAALSDWCDGQSKMVAFTGICRVHRAEILLLRGRWSDALAEAQRAHERGDASRSTRGAALYLQGEVSRLGGELAAAEQAYRLASESGCEPLPGLALVRLAERQTDAAAAIIRRAVDATADPLRQSRLLPAFVEIMLAASERDDARTAATKLGALAARFDADVLRAQAAYARGIVELDAGDLAAAAGSLRSAWQTWQQLDVPYEEARARAELGRVYERLGDADGARLELDAARQTLQRLGAPVPERAPAAPPRHSHGLSARELEVLRLVAAGMTNKAIAAELFLSEKTIDRHVSNILAKLDVSSRTAATAFAYQHELL
jgi:DNA-binding NarL/FixJ family response regulator